MPETVEEQIKRELSDIIEWLNQIYCDDVRDAIEIWLEEKKDYEDKQL